MRASRYGQLISFWMAFVIELLTLVICDNARGRLLLEECEGDRGRRELREARPHQYVVRR
jgi:hypothetical protein